MKCPLLAMMTFREAVISKTPIADCLKEECAWWHRANDRCSFTVLAQGITYLHKILLDIERKMPHKE